MQDFGVGSRERYPEWMPFLTSDSEMLPGLGLELTTIEP